MNALVEFLRVITMTCLTEGQGIYLGGPERPGLRLNATPSTSGSSATVFNGQTGHVLFVRPGHDDWWTSTDGRLDVVEFEAVAA